MHKTHKQKHKLSTKNQQNEIMISSKLENTNREENGAYQ